MTTRLNPDGPALEIDGEPVAEGGDKISDSSWAGLDEPEEDQTQANLRRIAKARKSGNRTEG